MNKRSRIKATLNGEEVDRPAVSFWRHFYKEEGTAEGLAEVMLGFQRKYDWDFMKVNPRAEYHVEDWGNTYEYSGNDFIKPRFLEGGIDHVGSLKENSPEKALQEAEKACDETGGKRWMLGGGCTFSPEVREENLMALRKVFDVNRS